MLKTVLGRAATAPPALALFRPFTRRCGTIFMLHRFARPELSSPGITAEHLRWVLRYLRSRRFRLVSLEEIVAAYSRDPAALTRAVAFTVDDGYDDFAAVAAPIFAEFDCPVTVFLATGFIDDRSWLWWDRILHAFDITARRTLELPELPGPARRSWSSRAQSAALALGVVEAAKELAPAERALLIERIVDRLEVAQPRTLPERFAPMSWATIRRLEAAGVHFGPHTVTHPLLAQIGDAEARWEMSHSWDRLRQELRRPCPIFCYPNGRPSDVLPRDIRVASEIGMSAAVSTAPLHVTPADPALRYFLPRFGLPETRWEVRMHVQGLERAKARLRNEPGTATFLVPEAT